MTLPLQMTLRGASYSHAFEQAAQKRAAKLQNFNRDLKYIRVVYEVRHRAERASSGGELLLMVGLPGDCIVAHQHCRPAAGEPYDGLNKLFDQAERALRKRRRSLRRCGDRIVEKLSPEPVTSQRLEAQESGGSFSASHGLMH